MKFHFKNKYTNYINYINYKIQNTNNQINNKIKKTNHQLTATTCNYIELQMISKNYMKTTFKNIITLIICNVVDVVGVVAKIGIPAKKKNIFMEPKTNELGIKYYEKLPESARKAELNDFLSASGGIKWNKFYLLESSDGKFFYLKRTFFLTSIEKLSQYIINGQIYVSIKEDKKP